MCYMHVGIEANHEVTPCTCQSSAESLSESFASSSASRYLLLEAAGFWEGALAFLFCPRPACSASLQRTQSSNQGKREEDIEAKNLHMSDDAVTMALDMLHLLIIQAHV